MIERVLPSGLRIFETVTAPPPEGEKIALPEGYTRTWYDLEASVWFAFTDYAMKFTVYECVEATDSTGRKHPWYKPKGDCNYGTEKIAEAEPYISGHVKWDGCSNWDFSPGEAPGMAHFCSRSGLANFGAILLRVYDEAKNMPLWDGDE